VEAMTPAKSPIVLRPFIEAYFVAASALTTFGDEPVSVSDLRKASMALGEQLFVESTIRNHEAVSTALFASAAEVLEGRGLLSADLDQREAFRDELDTILAAMNGIAAL
jgi:glycerol-3-phosphate O-acyltransferase